MRKMAEICLERDLTMHVAKELSSAYIQHYPIHPVKRHLFTYLLLPPPPPTTTTTTINACQDSHRVAYNQFTLLLPT